MVDRRTQHWKWKNRAIDFQVADDIANLLEERATYAIGESRLPPKLRDKYIREIDLELEKLRERARRIRRIRTINREPWRTTYGKRGLAGVRHRLLDIFRRWILDFGGVILWHTKRILGEEVGRAGGIGSKTVRALYLLSRSIFRLVNRAFDFADIITLVQKPIRRFLRWWGGEMEEEVRRKVVEEYIRNIPPITPVFEPEGSVKYAKALREYARHSKRDVRDILINSSIAVCVGAGKRGLIRKSTRPTTTQLKQRTRKYYTEDAGEGVLRIQKLLGIASGKIGRNVRIEDKSEARSYVRRVKVNPLTRSRAIYYQAGWFQAAQELSKHQRGGRRKFEYKGKIKSGLGTASVTPRGRLNHEVTIVHRGVWARQSAQVAIEEAIENETRGKLNQVKKRQEEGWRKMRTK